MRVIWRDKGTDHHERTGIHVANVPKEEAERMVWQLVHGVEVQINGKITDPSIVLWLELR